MGRVIGILGGGQLARMSMLAGHNLGIESIVLDPDPKSPASQVGSYLVGDPKSVADVANLMKQCDVLTFESEFIPVDVVRQAAEETGFDLSKVIPGIECVKTIQDKLAQKQCLQSAGVSCPGGMPALEWEGEYPVILKSRFGGYDGKGTQKIDSREEFDEFAKTVDLSTWMAEWFVDFEHELSVMVVCDLDGNYHTFPAMISEQVHNVCDLVYPLKRVKTARVANQVAVSAIKAIGGKGIFGVELFLNRFGMVMVNEIAPRPHNSGHFTQNWGGTSQFEAHFQVLNGTLNGVLSGAPTCMANLLGVTSHCDPERGLAAIADMPGVHLHWYGKKTCKPGRKMGHINVTGVSDIVETAKEARKRFNEACYR